MSMGDNDREIFDRLGKIEQTVARIDERESGFLPRVDDHEKRLQTLELKDAKRGGFIAGIASIASLLSSILTWLVSHFIHLPGGSN